MSRADTLANQLSESEYQLIDTERFKSQMRASRIANIPQFKINEHSSQPGFKFRTIDDSVELPISHFSQPVKQKGFKMKSSQKDLAEKSKEIEDVIYYDGQHKNSGYVPHYQDLSLGTKKEHSSETKQLMQKESRFKTVKQNDETKHLNLDSRQTNHIVEILEKLSSERKKHGEAGYFKHKQRDIEEVCLDQLFSKYSQSAVHQSSREVESEQQLQKDEDFRQNAQKTSKHSGRQSKNGRLEVSKSSQQEQQKSKYVSIKHNSHDQQHIYHEKEAHSKNNLSIQCLLCKVSKLNLKTPQKSQINQINYKTANPFEMHHQKIQKTQDLQTFTEPRIMHINPSPRNNIKLRYLSSEDKKQFYRKSSVQPDQTMIEQGKLKKQYLRELQSRKNQPSKKPVITQKQQLTLQSLGNSIIRSSQKGASNQKYKTPRKKIFSGVQAVSSKPYIKIENNREVQGNNKQQIKKMSHNRTLSASKSPYKGIFTAKQKPTTLTKDNTKTITRELNFNHIRQELVDSRVKTYRQKQKEKEKQSSPSRKSSLIPSLRLLDMNTEVRKWYQQNRKEIVFQAERICSYDLINRYMTEQEISSRLFNLVSGMVEPRRWVLMMVDQVYARLKDRYLPE